MVTWKGRDLFKGGETGCHHGVHRVRLFSNLKLLNFLDDDDDPLDRKFPTPIIKPYQKGRTIAIFTPFHSRGVSYSKSMVRSRVGFK